MKRWNGWGDETIHNPLPASTVQYLEGMIGKGALLRMLHWANISKCWGIRLPAHPLISTDPEERLRHARGQSIPDWIALPSGQIGTFPDGVAYPVSDQQVRTLLEYAKTAGVKVIPLEAGRA